MQSTGAFAGGYEDFFFYLNYLPKAGCALRSVGRTGFIESRKLLACCKLKYLLFLFSWFWLDTHLGSISPEPKQQWWEREREPDQGLMLHQVEQEVPSSLLMDARENPEKECGSQKITGAGAKWRDSDQKPAFVRRGWAETETW